jgi:hypothetical protein
VVKKPIVIEETLDDEPEAVAVPTTLEQCVMASLSPVPQNAKTLLATIKSKFPCATKSDINSILYKNTKTIKKTIEQGVSAPLWSV